MKYKVMILVIIVMAVSKIIHKNLNGVSTEKVHFQETFVQKGEDGICHFTSKDDKTITMSKPYSSLDDCIKDGGNLIKPKINKLELNYK